MKAPAAFAPCRMKRRGEEMVFRCRSISPRVITSRCWASACSPGASMKNEVRKSIHEAAPEAPVYREFTMDFLTRRSMLQLSFTTLTLGVLSVLAVILGAVGLYDTLSYVVAERT